MKSFIGILAFVALAAADVSHLQHHDSHKDAEAQILKQSVDVGPEQFGFNFETSNGIAAQEIGQLKNVGKEDEALEVQGFNQHTAPDGTVIKTEFIANENGYQPQGEHLPTPPPTQPIPEYILRGLAYIESHPQPEDKTFKRL